MNEIVRNLFKYFQLRGFIMTSGQKDEKERPRVISLDDESPEEYRCFESLEEIKEAGPEYLEDFYDFTMGFVHGML